MTESEIAEMARGAQSAGVDFADDAAPDNYDPLYCVTRGREGDVIVHWSEMTDGEREQAWRDYERPFGTTSEGGEVRFVSDPTMDRGRVVIRKDENIIVMAPTVAALAIVSYELVVGEELRAYPATMPHEALDHPDARKRAGL